MEQWVKVVHMDQIPVLGARIIKTRQDDIALFRGGDQQVFALKDACPHQAGPLSQGIVHGTSVTCPLHNWRIDLPTGQAQGADSGCSHTFPVKVEAGEVYLYLPVDML